MCIYMCHMSKVQRQFFPNIFYLWLVEFTDAEPLDKEGQRRREVGGQTQTHMCIYL